MRSTLGFSKYLAVSFAGHAVALVGISCGFAAYQPAELLGASEIFNISLSADPGAGSKGEMAPLMASPEAPAQALLPVNQPEITIKPKKPVAHKEIKNDLVRARFNPQQLTREADHTNDTAQGGTGNSGGSGDRGGGSVGGLATVYAPKPPYPWAARVAGFEGRVVLELNITDQGHVSEARILESSGRDDCDNSALKTVREKWAFEPAKINGTPVNCTEKVSVRYVLR